VEFRVLPLEAERQSTFSNFERIAAKKSSHIIE
jgi:hypothetical protein